MPVWAGRFWFNQRFSGHRKAAVKEVFRGSLGFSAQINNTQGYTAIFCKNNGAVKNMVWFCRLVFYTAFHVLFRTIPDQQSARVSLWRKPGLEIVFHSLLYSQNKAPRHRPGIIRDMGVNPHYKRNCSAAKIADHTWTTNKGRFSTKGVLFLYNKIEAYAYENACLLQIPYYNRCNGEFWKKLSAFFMLKIRRCGIA